MLLSLVPAASTMAADESSEDIRTAEWQVLSHMNKIRARHGLAPLRMATGVRDTARARSRSMRNEGYFGHVSPSGLDAGAMLRRRNLKHRSWSENIGWASFPSATAGARQMVEWWKDSPGHRRNMLDQGFNYAGIGITKGKRSYYYTVVFVSMRDQTPPKAGLFDAQAGVSIASASSSAKVTVRWWGRDRQLSARTAGLRGFSIHYKRGDGKWRPLLVNTKKRSLTRELPKGTHMFRVRAADKQGNRGSWMRPLRVVVK